MGWALRARTPAVPRIQYSCVFEKGRSRRGGDDNNRTRRPRTNKGPGTSEKAYVRCCPPASRLGPAASWFWGVGGWVGVRRRAMPCQA